MQAIVCTICCHCVITKPGIRMIYCILNDLEHSCLNLSYNEIISYVDCVLQRVVSDVIVSVVTSLFLSLLLIIVNCSLL